MSDRHMFSRKQPRAKMLRTPFRIPDSKIDGYARPRGFECVCGDKASRIINGKPLCANCKPEIE